MFVLGAVVASLLFMIAFSDLWKYRKLDQVLKQTGTKAYHEENYNCVDFTTEAKSKLSEKNIASNIIVVKKDENSTHALISVWFDPQTGEFAEKSDYLGDYNELKNKFGWANTATSDK